MCTGRNDYAGAIVDSLPTLWDLPRSVCVTLLMEATDILLGRCWRRSRQLHASRITATMMTTRQGSRKATPPPELSTECRLRVRCWISLLTGYLAWILLDIPGLSPQWQESSVVKNGSQRPLNTLTIDVGDRMQV